MATPQGKSGDEPQWFGLTGCEGSLIGTSVLRGISVEPQGSDREESPERVDASARTFSGFLASVVGRTTKNAGIWLKESSDPKICKR